VTTTRNTKDRFALIVGTIVVAGSIIAALAIHAPRLVCSYPGGGVPPKCPQPTNHLVIERAGIIVGGMIIALAVYIASRILGSRGKMEGHSVRALLRRGRCGHDVHV